MMYKNDVHKCTCHSLQFGCDISSPNYHDKVKENFVLLLGGDILENFLSLFCAIPLGQLYANLLWKPGITKKASGYRVVPQPLKPSRVLVLYFMLVEFP